MSDEFEKLLILHCSPTLLGLKQASLFSCPAVKEEEFTPLLGRYNILLNPKDIYFKVLYRCGARFYILTYRKKPMLASLKNHAVNGFLKSIGYPTQTDGTDYVEKMVLHLAGRITGCDSFPHEFGFFMGYPAQDVIAFIENGGRNYKFCGYWKVYGNEEEARRLFERYRKCREVLLKKAESGATVLNILGAA
ncbi:DUF3793 family protein [Anaerotignum faecicola]|nr:DUF3793 family protein [Anaerotignum faecicola]